MYHPVLFQDDIGKASKTIEEAQLANDRMEELMESKLLDFNLDKSCCIVIGDKSARMKILKKLKQQPLKLNGKMMKIVDSEKYLGEILSTNLTQSVHETVTRRVGLANHSVFEIRAVVDDAKAEAVGRLSVGFNILETAVIPAFLHSSEVWVKMKMKTIKLMEKIQLKYLRLVTGVGTGCPKPILYYHTGTLIMFNGILLRKILFLYHVTTLSPSCLARSVYDTQCLLDQGLV